LGALTGAGALAARSSPKLTVAIILEQFRPDYLDAVRSRLIEGGLRRILDNGASFWDCRHQASTFTATTLATLATGAWPSVHGIVADTWYDRATRRPVRASDEYLFGSTLAAEAAASPRCRAFVIGMDPVRTRLFAGSAAVPYYWMDARGQFMARGDTPEWLVAYNRQKPIENFRNAPWMAIGAGPDSPPLRTLTYAVERPDDFYLLYRASPFAQMAQFEFLREFLTREKVGQGPTTDLVCLLLGSTEALGYDTGARSPLMEQMVMHLDRHLEFLFDQLDRTPGRNEFNLVLTAAHGAPPAPAPDARHRLAIGGEQLAQTLQKALAPAGPKLERYLYPFLYLDHASRESEAARLTAARVALAYPGVGAYYTAGGACSLSGDWAARFRNSFHLQRSGDVMLAYRPGCVEEFGAARGVTYGSLYNYDSRVPLVFYGPQFAKRSFEQPVESVDVAPTLARALGVAQPSAATGRVLGEAFRDRAESA
jgi:predicted AlkP superfamily pyrophosphatase or phosphodiesterase